MTVGGSQTWVIKSVDESTLDQVIELHNLGLSQTDIANELSVNKSTICRAVKKAKEDGLLTDAKPKSATKKTSARRVDVDD